MDNKVKKTIRVSVILNEQLEAIAKTKNITVNKLVSEILYSYINNLGEVSEIYKIFQKLEDLEKYVDNCYKKVNWNSLLTRQIFLNCGFPRNRSAHEDKAFREFTEGRYTDKYNF